MSDGSIVYQAPPTIAAFLSDNSFVRGITGPFGSGKSSGCSIEFLLRAQMQEPAKDGIRYTRFAAVRNTYPELRDTTRRTIEDWLPSGIRSWSETSYSYTVRFNDVHCEIMLRPLDKPEDVKKLLSLELTGAWVNEAKEVPKAVIDGLTGRVGRFPGPRLAPCTWSGIWMDTNPPDTDHWWYKAFEEDKPEGWGIHRQPSGLAPNAENISNLLGGQRTREGVPLYYARMMAGKAKEWVEVFVHGRYGFVKDGKPVYPEYNNELHTLTTEPAYLGGILLMGMDFGLTPAIVVAQRTPAYQYQVLREFVSESMGAVNFSKLVATELKRDFPKAAFRGWGDPAGSSRSQVDERTPYEVVQSAGLPIDPTHTNDFVRRREAVSNKLTRLTMTGKPSLVISPRCKVLRKAMNGAYCFRRVQVAGAERFKDAPDKNDYSHVAEALQYLLVGEGEDDTALDGDISPDSTEARRVKYKVIPSVPLRRHRR
jgi:hypothetical protein